MDGGETFQTLISGLTTRGDVRLITFPNAPKGHNDIKNLEELLPTIKLEAPGKTCLFFRG